MSSTIISKRYATALLMLAREKGLEEQIGTELRTFAGFLDESGALQQVLENPAIRRDERLKVVEVLVELAGLSKITSNFLRLCVEKGRAGIIGEAMSHYGDLLDEALGRVRATVSSTRVLNDEAVAALKAKLEEMTGKQVVLSTKIDPSLLGGVVTRVGSLVFDGSVRGRLDALRDRLIQEAGK